MNENKYAVLIGEHYLLNESGTDYAVFNNRTDAEELALDFADHDAEVVAL